MTSGAANTELIVFVRRHMTDILEQRTVLTVINEVLNIGCCESFLFMV